MKALPHLAWLGARLDTTTLRAEDLHSLSSPQKEKARERRPVFIQSPSPRPAPRSFLAGRVTKLPGTGSLLAALVMAVAPSSALACATCFGKSDSDLAKAMNWGILSLLAVVVLVLSGFAAFFIYLARRAAMTANAEAAAHETLRDTAEPVPR